MGGWIWWTTVLWFGMSQSKSRRARRTRSYDRCFTPSPSVAARTLCRQAAALDTPLALERWASSLLGRLWERRDYVAQNRGIDPLFLLGRPILRSFAAVGANNGKIALTAVSRIDRGPLGRFAGELAASLGDAAMPDWIEQVGSSTIVGASAERSPGDGEALLLEPEVVGDGAHMLAVFIADRRGGAASVLALTRKLGPAEAASWAGAGAPRGLRLRPVDAALACQRAREAIERTDDVLGAWIDENFADNRALAIARITAPQRAVKG
jgi:hypothetical protein